MMGFFDKVKKALGSSKNFKYFDDLIHSGVKEIVLDSDIVLGRGEKSEYLEGIELDVDDLVIDGNGHSIDAKGKTRIFNINSKAIIKNLTLKNGYAVDGGAINTKRSGDVEINNCQFQKNASKERGGAIYNSGELTISESTLNNNTAQKKGGAICNGGELTISESTLSNNIAKGKFDAQGGTIYNGGELTMSESTITENRADVGGAIYNSAELTISESTITENRADVGGAIYNSWSRSLIITESALTGNTADTGGAIHNIGELTITESILTGNTANRDGGAIYNRIGYSFRELTIAESTLSGNTADCDGGAIHNKEGNFKIFNCEFSSNKSPNNIILNNDSLQIHNTNFKDNQSKDIILNDGGGANLGIFNGEFKENTIKKSVLYNSGKFSSIERTAFETNISDNTVNNIVNECELTLTNPKIKDNEKSILNQKYILIRNSPYGLENTIFGEGTVETIESRILHGESFDFGYLDEKIHESNTKEIILEHDITFENYEMDFYEGGIELDMDDLIINGNGHIIDGSGKSRIFIITGKNITLKNIIFKNGHSHKNYDNPPNSDGGAIKINSNSNIIIENCEFLNNTSEGNCGAIDNGGELTITSSTLIENIAKDYGGAILNLRGELTIVESTITENMAYSGGAIYNVEGELTIAESVLSGNTAQGTGAYEGGGAIFNFSGGLTVIKSTLRENMADSGGAISNRGSLAIYNMNGELTITESILTENTVQKKGGAIYNDGDKLTITESALTENNAKEDGGGIYNEYGELTINDSILSGNTAQIRGGAIYLTESEKYESQNCTFKDNEPDDVYEEKQ